MASVSDEQGPPAKPRPKGRPARLTALPSVQARALAFVVIVVAGICGALIGSSFAKVGCTGDCTTSEGIAGVIGAAVAAVGVAVIAVLVLRAMGEWRTIKEERALEAAAVPSEQEVEPSDDGGGGGGGAAPEPPGE